MGKIFKAFAFFCVNRVLKGTRFFSLKRALLNGCKDIRIGKNTKIVGPLRVYGALTVGEECWIGHDFSVEGNGAVTIGDRSDIAPFVRFYTGSHMIGPRERRAGEGFNADIHVGNGCWLGAEVRILPGVSVGDGCVAALGTVITRDTEADGFLAGVPAVEKKKLGHS